MSDYTELVKRLRYTVPAEPWDRAQAADAIEEQAATIATNEHRIAGLILSRDFEWELRKKAERSGDATIARLSARLEAEVRARHQSTIAAYLPGILRKCIAPDCLNRYETEGEFVAHVNEAVAEAAGGQP